MVRISAFEAKTHLSQFLDQTRRGREFLILKRGRPVAKLVPAGEEEGSPNAAKAIARLIEFRDTVRCKKVDIRKLIETGRRF